MDTTAPTDRCTIWSKDPDGRTPSLHPRLRGSGTWAKRRIGEPRGVSLGLWLVFVVSTGGASVGCDASVNISLLPLASDGNTSSVVFSDDASGVDATVVAALPDAALMTLESSASNATQASQVDAGSTSERLLHHYDFVGDGATVPDLVGDADGLVVGGAVLDATGALELDGSDDYVDLPNGLLSSLDAATITLWVEWRGGIAGSAYSTSVVRLPVKIPCRAQKLRCS